MASLAAAAVYRCQVPKSCIFRPSPSSGHPLHLMAG